MPGPDNRLEENIYRSVTRGYEWLFTSGRDNADWGSVDHNSLVLLSLILREPKNSLWITAPKEKLLSEQEDYGSDAASWGESVYDTSLALMALLLVGVQPSDPKIEKGLRYLQQIYQANGRNNWEDEPWETSWAVLAVYESGNRKLAEDVCRAVRWLQGLQGADGSIISPHYTAYFLKLVSTLQKDEGAMGVCSIDSPQLERSAKAAVDYLIRNVDEEILWTGESWSNGQILWALTSTGRFPIEDERLADMAVGWFMKNQCPEGNWCDAEDTACAIIGLIALLKQHLKHHISNGTNGEDADTVIFNHLRRLYIPPKPLLSKKFVQRLDDGTTTINFTPRMLRIATIMFAIVSGFTVFVAVYEFLKDYLGW